MSLVSFNDKDKTFKLDGTGQIRISSIKMEKI